MVALCKRTPAVQASSFSSFCNQDKLAAFADCGPLSEGAVVVGEVGLIQVLHLEQQQQPKRHFIKVETYHFLAPCSFFTLRTDINGKDQLMKLEIPLGFFWSLRLTTKSKVLWRVVASAGSE